LWRKRLSQPIGASSYCGTPTRLMTPPGRTAPTACRQDGHQADGAVPDHGDPGAAADAADHGRVVAGPEDVRERQQGRHEGGVRGDRQLDRGVRDVFDADIARAVQQGGAHEVPPPGSAWSLLSRADGSAKIVTFQ